MQSADLNLTTTVTGHQRFLFLKLPADIVGTRTADAALAASLGRLGDGLENMHHTSTGRPRLRRSGGGGSRSSGRSQP